MRSIEWFATNRVAANLLMVLIVVGGLLTLPRLRQEILPTVPLGRIAITIEHPDAAPDAIEEAICIRVEEAIDGVSGIRRVQSTAFEGRALVSVELDAGADPQRVLDDINMRVRGLDGLPDAAREPRVEELIDDNVLLSVAVRGDVPERVLRQAAERVREELAALPEAGLVELVGVRPYEVAVEVSEVALRRHGLSFDDVASAIAASSLDLPAGTLKTRGGEFRLRTRSRVEAGEEIAGLVLLTRPDGTRLRVRDVARVHDGFAETEKQTRLDGAPAAFVRFLERDAPDAIELSRAVRRHLATTPPHLPQGVVLDIWRDESMSLASRRDLMLANAAGGLLLVLAVITLFLGFRLAFWVSAGIPIAFLGAVAVMGVLDISINMLSLFGFILALGLVVDDAIVVGESVAREGSGRRSPRDAAIAGARRVAVPVIVAVLAAIVFQARNLFLPTGIGKLVISLAVVVIACLVFSLVESFWILPSHLSHAVGRGRGGRFARIERRRMDFAEWLEEAFRSVYRPVLGWALRRRGLTVSVALVALLLSGSLVVGSWVPFRVVPRVEADDVSAELVMPEGTPGWKTRAILGRIEAEALALGAELDAEAPLPVGGHLVHVLTSVGPPPDRFDASRREDTGAHRGRVRIELDASGARQVTSIEIEERWRERVGPIPEALALRFDGSGLGSEPAIQLRLAALDRRSLDEAEGRLRTELEALAGVVNVVSSRREGKQELRLSMRPEAEAHGLTLAEVTRQVRQGFAGHEVQRLVRGREDVAVVVRYPAHERNSLGDLEHVRIRTRDGDALPLSAVATLQSGRGDTRLEREDRLRVVEVSADVDPHRAALQDVLGKIERDVLPRMSGAVPAVDIRRSGLRRDEAELMKNMLSSWVIAALVTYALLAVPLGSYLKPLFILVMIPFGFVGAVVGHAILGLELSGFSLIGLMALSGVVVNDAMVLTDAANRMERDGATLRHALQGAAQERLRPILLTSFTTFFGLLPLLTETSAQAAWLRPMAVTLAFGVLFATAITLLLLPALTLLVADLRLGAVDTWRWARGKGIKTLARHSPTRGPIPGRPPG